LNESFSPLALWFFALTVFALTMGGSGAVSVVGWREDFEIFF